MVAYQNANTSTKDEEKQQAQFRPIMKYEGSGGGENISFLDKLRGLTR